MHSNNKRIAKNTLMLYIRMILITLVSLYTSRIVLNILGFDDFGIYNVVGGIVVMLGFLNSAMSSATQRFLSYELGRADDLKLRRVFNTSINIHIIIAIIVVVLAETVGLWFLNNKIVIAPDRIVAAQWVYQFSVMTFVVNVLSVPYNAMIISHERMSVFAYVSIAEVVLKLGIVYMLTLFTIDKLELYAILMFTVSLLIRIIYQIYCTTNFTACKYKFEWNVSLIKEMLSFAGWSLFGGFGTLAKFQGINIVLNVFFGVIINAAWGIALQVNSAVFVLVANFTTALNPPIVKSYVNKDFNNTNLLLFNGMKYSFVLASCIIFPFLINTNEILSFWLKATPSYTVEFVQLILISGLIDSILSPIGTVIQATGKVKYFQLIVGSISILTIPVAYFIFEAYNSPIHIYYVLIFTTISAMIARFVILYRQYKYSMKDLFKLLSFITIVTLANMPLFIIKSIIGINTVAFFVTSIASAAIILTLLFFCGMSVNEKAIISSKLKLIKNRIVNY